MEKKKVLVIGLGPGGGILAAYLSNSNNSVYGIDPWIEHVAEIKENGLSIVHFASIHTYLEKVYNSFDELDEKGFDYVVIAVKTPNLPEVIDGLRNLPGYFDIIVAQNGIDNEEYVARFFPRERIFRMALHYAGNMISPGTIRMNFFQKPNRIGCICTGNGCSHSEEFAAILTHAGLDTTSEADIRKYTWKKGILNAILAPVSATLGVTMAEVMDFEPTRQIVDSLIRECIEVAKAVGYDYGENFFDECVGFLKNAGHHKPSMLIDLEKGNPTEIDYISAKIVESAKLFNIPAPVNATITGLVKAREKYNSVKRRET